MEKVKVIWGRLLAAQSRQKAYADNQHRDLEFSIGDMVFLKVSPMKGTMRKGKLSPRYIRLYEILERVHNVVYRIALPPDLEGAHPIFHASMLRKYLPNPSHVI